MADRIFVAGAGSWGTALALHLDRIGHSVLLWTRDSEQADRIRSTRRNPGYLPGIILPESIAVETETSAAANCGLVLVAVPSRGVLEMADRLKQVGLRLGCPVVSCVKGLEYNTGRRMSEILSSALPAQPVAVLSGPSHAEEVALDKPTAVVLGAADPALAGRLREDLAGGHLRIYSSHDTAGIELGGALKNVFAIAAGVGDGLGLGDNSKAALVTRSLAEMIRIGTALGGERETFQGLSGVGDLMVTCFSQHSRNRRLGELLGRGTPLEEAEAILGQVAEGVPATESTLPLVDARQLRAPITRVVHQILFESLPAAEALRALMERDLRQELE